MCEEQFTKRTKRVILFEDVTSKDVPSTLHLMPIGTVPRSATKMPSHWPINSNALHTTINVAFVWSASH